MGLSLRRIGRWEAAEDKINPRRFQRGVLPIAALAISMTGNAIAKEAKSMIRTNRAVGPALAASTIMAKGSSTRLLDTDELHDSIIFRRRGLTRGFVGVPDNRRHPSGSRMSDIMMAHEIGTSHVPARRVLTPAATKIEKRVIPFKVAAIFGTFWAGRRI